MNNSKNVGAFFSRAARALVRPKRVALALCLTAAVGVTACSRSTPRLEGERPVIWAQPVDGGEDLPNFFKVDDGLYRGAQPTEAGFRRLKELGIKTVVNLRAGNPETEICEQCGLDYVDLPARAWSMGDTEVETFLKIVNDPERQPVFVHCRRGADRTGMIVAAYRIAKLGWDTEEAAREMAAGGFGFNPVWFNLLSYVRTLKPPQKLASPVAALAPSGAS
jgi:uncharacterized protein (TIGR01244 family)